MTVHFSKELTRGGFPYVNATSSGEVSEHDALKLNAALDDGGPYGDLPILGRVDASASFSADSHQAFARSSMRGNRPVAIVVSNAPLRAVVSFVARLSGTAGATRFFHSEALAIDWLDEVSGQPRASSSLGYAARNPHAS